jgi:hypothetical protein
MPVPNVRLAGGLLLRNRAPKLFNSAAHGYHSVA